MKISLLLKSVLIFSAGISLAHADNDLIIPERLINNDQVSFYKKADVCEHAKAVAPDKIAAMVIVKTHYCDGNSQVCLKTTSLVADPANHFVHDNFTVYQTRFASQDRHIENSGEADIRQEWQKFDSNPEFYIIDLRSCEIVFREFAKTVYQEGMFSVNSQGTHLDFAANYRAMRLLLLESPAVRNLLGNKYEQENETQIRAELERSNQIRAQHAQQSLQEVMESVNIQDMDSGLRYKKPSSLVKAFLKVF